MRHRSRPSIYLENTTVDSMRTASEIQDRLVRHGAIQVLNQYANGEITGLHFILDVDGRQVPFKMPVRTEKIAAILNARKRGLNTVAKQKNTDKAKRIAWRQLLRWVEVQLAMVETGMAKTAEVFLSYVQISATETYFERIESQHFKALMPAPEE